jgi:hypothetical protein
MSEHPSRYWVSPNGDGTWTVKVHGEDEAPRRFDSKSEAVAHATQVAKEHSPSQVVIQHTDGTVEDEKTYGRDASHG